MKFLISRIIVLSVCIACVSGCDFIRTIAGRPTSEDIEAKKSMMLAEYEKEVAQRDSADAVLKKQALEVASLDSLKATGCKFVNVSDIRARITSELSSEYCIICGAFSDRSNAERMAAKLLESGCESEFISYRNGSTAIGASPSGDISVIYRHYVSLREKKLIPEDSWILVNE